MFTKTWERYLFRELFKTFIFFLAAFYFLYVVVDYSAHMQDFIKGKSLSLSNLFLYYCFQFVKRADILLPLALIVSSIRLLLTLNLNKELLAFQSAGLSWKKLLRPFYFVALSSTLVIAAFNQFALPSSLNFIDKFYDTHLRHSHRGNRSDPLHVIHLEDHSKLVYQYYDSARQAFFDVVWMRSPDELWRIKYLQADPNNPIGEYVDHLVRTDEGHFEKRSSFDTLLFRDLKWRSDLPRKGFIPFENRSITSLYHMLKEDQQLSAYQSNELLTQILYKSVMPLLAPLVLICCAPFCIRYGRQLPQLLIYALSIFGFVGFIALMDAAVILGENATISPYLAIFFPFSLITLFFGWNYATSR
ncbi:MAG: hypothetical protein K940chlam2_00188 [Chlamydiae bacterium]|nr:hypothetical protein [Chlamydiota bacterium]